MLRPTLVRTGLLLALAAALTAGPVLAAPGRGGAPARPASRPTQPRSLGAWVLSLLGVWPAKPGMIIDPNGADLPKEPGLIIDPSGGD